MGGENVVESVREREEREQREGVESGVSMEAEFAFTRAIGDFCREGVREGSYKGNYVLNLKEQMEERVRRREGELRKYSVLFVGGSQIGRIAEEVGKVGKQVVRQSVYVKVKGELSEEEMVRVCEEVEQLGQKFDKVVVGGPANSLVKHGMGERRGHRPERTVTVERDGSGRVTKIGTRYHGTEPTRVTLTERRDLTVRMVKLIDSLGDIVDADETLYVTMFPRHVDRCCGREGHMTEGDCLTMTSVRNDIDKDIREEIKDRKLDCNVLDWWKLLKLDGDCSVQTVREKGLVSEDGVHLSVNANRSAAVVLCHRFLEGMEEDGWSETASTSSKRQRME